MHLYKSKKVKSHYTSCRNGPINPIKRDKVNKGKIFSYSLPMAKKALRKQSRIASVME